jgi:hypothetical protein
MALVSMGRINTFVTYTFDTPFDVVSNGPGWWGNGLLVEQAGNQLVGNEGHGLIQFSGTVSSISWSSTEENWHGFTIGIPVVAGVPEPSTLILLGAGILGLFGYVRRRKD